MVRGTFEEFKTGLYTLILPARLSWYMLTEISTKYINYLATLRNIIDCTTNENMTEIEEDTYMRFLDAYNKVDKTRDIYLLMQSDGGQLTYAEAIVNCISMHSCKYKSKFICVVPVCACSSGFYVALFCDRIIMHSNAFVGPCDIQKKVGSRYYSAAAIVYAVEQKLKCNDTIDEEWYAAFYEAQRGIDRQRAYVDMLLKRYDKECVDRIYDEFFSGKHNHDKNIYAQELVEMGLNVEILDTLPI